MDGSIKKLKENSLIDEFINTRKKTNQLISTLHSEDMVIQTEDLSVQLNGILVILHGFLKNFCLFLILRDTKCLVRNLIIFLTHITIALGHSILEKKGLFKQTSFKRNFKI